MKDLKKNLLISSIAIIAIILLSLAFGSGLFSIVGQEVLLPEVSSVECRATSDTQLYDMADAPWKNNWHEIYLTPAKDFNTPEVEVKYQVNGLWTYNLMFYEKDGSDWTRTYWEGYFADGKYHSLGFLKARDYPGDFTGEEWKVLARDYQIFPKRLEKGQIIIRQDFERYDLVDIGSHTGKHIAKNTCDLRKLGSGDVFTSDLQEARNDGRIEGYYLGFGQVMNYITGASPVYDSMRVVDWDKDGHVDRYIHRVGYYYPIVKGASGKLYADTREEKYDANIVCLPSPYCKDGREIISPEESECSALSGGIIGYAPLDSNTVCKWHCVSGKLVAYDCKDIPTCNQNQILNEDYECVDIGSGTSESSSGFLGNWTQWLIYIIMTAIGAVFGYLMSKKDRIIWAVGGGLLGLVSAFVIQWIYNNWLILVIGGVLGGVGLYILGPTILAVVLIFVEIIKSARGG